MNKKHILFMLLCCLIPVAALALIFWLEIPTNTVIWGAMILICPISHLAIMFFMRNGHSEATSDAHTSPPHICRNFQEKYSRRLPNHEAA
jgi:hypothetical protein